MSGGVQATTLRNAMSVDVEDWFQVGAFAKHIDRRDWDNLPCRVERNTDRVLAMFDSAGVKATFFTLGWVAERYPALIRRITAQGHELASHGYAHFRADEQDPVTFRADVRQAKRRLEDTAGMPVSGYRAASFSIGAKNLWALEILADEGYRYSSSVYPVQHDTYGMPSAPRFAFNPVAVDGFTELPITTTPVMGRNLPCGGGGYFRLLPYALTSRMLRRVNAQERQACIFYFHPWEIDPDQPRQHQASWRSRFRHYTNLERMQAKLERLLNDFSWGRMDQLPALSGGAA